MLRKLSQEERTAYALVIPVVLYTGIFILYPLSLACYLGLTNTTVASPGNFVGLANFVRLVQTRSFRSTLYNTALYFVIAVSLKTVLGLVLALLLHRITVFARPIRAIVLLPWVTPIAFTTIAWRWIFDPQYSSLNWALRSVGIISRNIPWLSFPSYARIAVITVNIWRGLPFFALNILAGLKTIPQELYEAAKVDGAGAWTQFTRITLPSLAPVLAMVVLFSTIMTISDFTIVYALTKGGPIDSTHLLATLAYQTGLTAGFLGQGAAIALFVFPVLLVVVYFQLKIVLKRWAW